MLYLLQGMCLSEICAVLASFAMCAGVDIEMARNSERELMTIDARQLLNAVSRGESPTLYRHPTSGATALHVAAAKGYINVIR